MSNTIPSLSDLAFKSQNKKAVAALILASPGAYAAHKVKEKHGDDPIFKGALIGAKTQAAVDVAAVGLGGLALSKMTGTTFKQGLKAINNDMVKLAGSKGKLGALAAAGIACSALIGAGIGKLVKNHQEKKQAKEAE